MLDRNPARSDKILLSISRGLERNKLMAIEESKSAATKIQDSLHEFNSVAGLVESSLIITAWLGCDVKGDYGDFA